MANGSVNIPGRGVSLKEHLKMENMVLSDKQYGDELPEAGTPGRLFFVPEERFLVGALYLSADETSPAELFGGTWEQLEDTFSDSVYIWQRVA